jgi:phosphoglycerate dehydrogenase-like enzyme
MKVLVIPGLTLPEVSDADVERIRKAAGSDTKVVVCPLKQALEHADDTEIIFGPAPVDLFRQARDLRWVQAIASGVDGYLYPEFVESDVILTSEKGLVGEHLADHAFGLLLMLSRQLATAYRLGADSWNHRVEMRRQEFELTGLTMGIFGFGGTGRAMARRATAFGMRCVALDRDPVAPGDGVTEVWRSEAFEQLLESADILSVCCPLTTETRALFDQQAFRHMKDSAYLVNVTRGEVMVEEDLINALRDGQIAGAALDVAPREPLPADSPLWALPNVVMTPHTAGASQFRAARNLTRFVENLERFRLGEPLEGVIDKISGY